MPANRSVIVSTLSLLALSLAACGGGGSASWETRTALSDYVAFTDFTPAGESTIYTTDSGNLDVYSITGNSFGSLTSAPISTDSYAGFAWYGNYLYTFTSYTLMAYSISGDSWSYVYNDSLPYSTSSSQATADDDGFVYAYSQDGNYELMQYDTIGDTLTTYAGPTDIGSDEPRAAWDSLSGRLYLADYDHTPFYAFNPVNGTFTSLAPFPGASGGFSDAFCSDRNGHIYTTGSACTVDKEMWKYTAATDTWSALPSLPFAHGCDASCTVAGGYLYFGDGNNYNFARIKL
jgi:hypothetical protein